MRRSIFLVLGILEIASAGVLYSFVWQLPGPNDVREKVGRIERVSRQAGAQVRNLRDDVRHLRQSQPRARYLADEMRTQLRYLGDNLKKQQIDYSTLTTLYDSFGTMANGLDGMSDRLAPDGFAQLGLAMRLTADYLDKQVCPAADQAADRLDKSIITLRSDAKGLAQVLQTLPNDLTSARAVHDSLAKFSDGLDGVTALLRPNNLETVRAGFVGLESALDIGADQVARLANFSYPIVTLSAGNPTVEYRKLWSEGATVAAGLRKASKGSAAVRKELDVLSAELPRVRNAVVECRKIADQTRAALAGALKHQDQTEKLLKNVPEHAARLAEELPKVGEELTRLLRDTARLREVAKVLRAGHEGIAKTAGRWPDLRKTLSGSADLLRATQTQLKHVLDNRQVYEASLQQSRSLIEGLSAALPMYTDQWGRDVAEQERSLSKLGTSIDEVSAVMPEIQTTGAKLILMMRLLLSLVAAIFLLHGGYLAIDFWLRHAILSEKASAPV